MKNNVSYIVVIAGIRLILCTVEVLSCSCALLASSEGKHVCRTLPKHTAQMFSMEDPFQNCINIGGVLPIPDLFSDLHLFSPAELFRITPGLDAMVTMGLHPVRMKCTRSSLRIQFLLVPLESTLSPMLDSWTCLWCGCVGQRHPSFPQGVFFDISRHACRRFI